MKEIWKEVKGYEGYYKISNLGRIKSVERFVGTIRNGKKTKNKLKEKILKGNIDKYGYKKIDLYKKGKRKNLKIHTIVANAFLNKTNENYEVNHKDENKLNNNVLNLEWVSHKENVNYGTCIKRSSKSRTKTIDFYEKNGITRRDFKIKCLKSNFDFKKFKEEFHSLKTNKNGKTVKKYTYKFL